MRASTCHRGRLISIEGLNGVGKTHLTTRLLARETAGNRPILLEEFSQRPHSGGDLGRELLRALIDEAHGDPFLRGGHLGTETLLLLAIKMFDYENGCAAALAAGRTVLEGRSVHSIAVYQSLIACPGDDGAAREYAQAILELAAAWRPLPELTILITDDVTAAVRRAETRDGRSYTPEQWRLHHRAALLFERLAADDPDTVAVLDRRELSADTLVDQMADLIATAAAACDGTSPGHLAALVPCQPRCRLQEVAA